MAQPEPQTAARFAPIPEHDACGVALVVHLPGTPQRRVVTSALTAVGRMAHRGGVAADGKTGDGAGIMLGLPHALLRAVAADVGVQLPDAGHYAVAMAFLARDPIVAGEQRGLVESELVRTGLRPLGWRVVPVQTAALGAHAAAVRPQIEQLFIALPDETVAVGPGAPGAPGTRDEARHQARDLRLWLARRRIEGVGRAQARRRGLAEADALYLPSLSATTLVYKGLGLPGELDRVFPDLGDPRCLAPMAAVHTRFSTNTLPAWRRAHPYRLLAHNGEINTIRGNAERMAARRGGLGRLRRLGYADALEPVLDPDGSDSAMLDEAAELLLRSGRSLAEAMRMLLQPARDTPAVIDPDADDATDDGGGDGREPSAGADALLGAWLGGILEPWDGPALAIFSDGETSGAALDRNGLRPARWVRTRDGLFVLASEIGVVDIEPAALQAVGRLGPGQIVVVQDGEVFDTGAIDARLAARAAGPGGDLAARLAARDVPLAMLVADRAALAAARAPIDQALPTLDGHALRAGWTEEDIEHLVLPMARDGKEALGAMGDDTPLPGLGKIPLPIGRHLRQLFAQVTNPPIDPIREQLVMRLDARLGDEGDLSDPDAAGRAVVLRSPVIDTAGWARLQACSLPGLRPARLDLRWTSLRPDGSLDAALVALGAQAVAQVRDGAGVLLLDDCAPDATCHEPTLPTLLAVSAVHHALVDAGLRSRVGVAVRSAEVRDVMDIALLVGFGASAVQPWLLDAMVERAVERGRIAGRPAEALARVRKALDAGLAKILSKMGISTIESYRGAKLFEAVGIDQALLDRWLPGVPCRMGGLDLDAVATNVRTRAAAAAALLPAGATGATALPPGGRMKWHREGEKKAWDPQAIGLLQHAVRSGNRAAFSAFTARADSARHGPGLRAALDLDKAGRSPIPLDEVESVGAIAARFRTGAMSFGSLSKEAHETLAVAMNRLGGRSNSGEGGEDLARERPLANGDSRRSAIRQVASGRFGVHGPYLVGARELQIKMAQGAKPGEGGQLPGHKVDATIAEVRCSTPGVGLVSPPPHHDIYSIEDLAQLIHDLRCANDEAEISVKLVSRAGVGTIAAGVAKAGADHVLISCGSGGTGAAPLSSIQHAGGPWELGILETQAALVRLSLRDRVRLEVDGQLKTGRDVVLAAALGAERFAFGTAALVAAGCVLMRVCHLNTCPVGVATQDPVLRAQFPGEPEHVVQFFTFVAEEVRAHLAALGLRSLDEATGRLDLLYGRPDAPGAAATQALLDEARALLETTAPDAARRFVALATPPAPTALEQAIASAVAPSLRGFREAARKVRFEGRVGNEDRSVATRVSSQIARIHGLAGLPAGTVQLALRGAAGQSLGAFLAPGVDLLLEGFANDAVGKGMWGGRLVVRAPRGAQLRADRLGHAPALIGNVALYGATAGELFVAGSAGERFAVRNSGAVAVVEGCGDHGAEYMTRGELLVLGDVGRNFGAGMSGGVVWVWDPAQTLAERIDGRAVALEAMADDDLQRVHELLRRHRATTDSPLAWTLLRNFSTARRQFRRVMPHELRTVLRRDAAAAVLRAQREAVQVQAHVEAG